MANCPLNRIKSKSVFFGEGVGRALVVKTRSANWELGLKTTSPFIFRNLQHIQITNIIAKKETYPEKKHKSALRLRFNVETNITDRITAQTQLACALSKHYYMYTCNSVLTVYC